MRPSMYPKHMYGTDYLKLPWRSNHWNAAWYFVHSSLLDYSCCCRRVDCFQSLQANCHGHLTFSQVRYQLCLLSLLIWLPWVDHAPKPSTFAGFLGLALQRCLTWGTLSCYCLVLSRVWAFHFSYWSLAWKLHHHRWSLTFWQSSLFAKIRANSFRRVWSAAKLSSHP